MFHELARHLQTRRLIAGDTLSLNQDKSFYCVVDGMVQVYAQSGHQPEVRDNLWDDEDMNGYQLLNEVGSGGTLSSLFTILSLFTEDIPMSWHDEERIEVDSIPHLFGDSAVPMCQSPSRTDSDVSDLDLGVNPPLPEVRPRRHSSSSSTSSTKTSSTFHASKARFGRAGSAPPSTYEDAASHIPSISESMGTPKPNTRRGVVARATVDSTLAVIPAEAFRRLTKKYPKATGHIVQGE